MKVFITGGTGFVGTFLSEYYLNRGDLVLATGSRPSQSTIDHGAFSYFPADTTVPGSWQERVKQADLVINLAGRSISKRWTAAYKKEIVSSRILTTKNLVAALPDDRPINFFSTSAVGFYGNRGDSLITENEPPADDFLGVLAVDWEKEARLAAKNQHRVILMRFGVVFGRGGGAYQQMAAVFRRFTGGPIGDGRQWFPWIHIEDVARAIDYIHGNVHLDGAFNFCAPNPSRNKSVAKAFGRALKRPAGMPAPAFVLRVVLGEFANTLLSSQRVVPERLSAEGFTFRYPHLDDALLNLVG